MSNQSNNYDASSIVVLEGLEAVRKRPGMYIGSTGPEGLHHLIWEIVDNSIDEAMAGEATTVTVILKKDGSVYVEDDGRGIPVAVHPKTHRPTVETVLTILHAGGKFDNSSYAVSGGLHGVGASCVNALSEWFKVWVVRDHKKYYIEFNHGGKVVKELTVVEENCEKEHGTTIQYYPDFTIMEKAEYDENKIITRLKQLAFLNKGLKIIFQSEITDKKDSWTYEGGIIEYVHELNRDKSPIIPDVIYGKDKQTFTRDNNSPAMNVEVEVAFQYNKSYSCSLYSFCNNIHTTEGGTHEEGFRLALTRIINNFAIEKKLLKETDDKITREDIGEGLLAILSVRHSQPLYEGQTKKKLGNSEVKKIVNNITSEIFEKFLGENPQEGITIAKKAVLAAEARRKSLEAKNATRRKSPFESTSLPGKLADCSSKDSSICELYIVEGDSAGGSAKLGRSRQFQAILPLRGKILNVEKASSSKIFESEEINNLINAIGAGVEPQFNLDKIRYNKIIIMTDADVDGAHIRILLLTFFYRYMKPIIEAGHVYAAQPPLYKFAQGKKVNYAYSDNELEELKQANLQAKYTVQRYKGLGEMNPEQLWETTMDPTNRILLQITIEDAVEADRQFSFLMGSEVEHRKDFIAENAKFVKNIDA